MTQDNKEQTIETAATEAAAEAPVETRTEPQEQAPSERPQRGYYQRGSMPHDPSARGSKFKKKSCRFCHDKDFTVDYKNPKMLERFITDRGKILPRRVTGTCARHQRAIARAIKKARTIALLPFVEK